MKSKIILAVAVLIGTFAVSAHAQGRHGRGNGYDGYNNSYNNGGNCGGNAYQNDCNNGYRGSGYGNGYGRRRGYYRPRPATYCQPVVIAPRPRYYAPRYAYGRPRININIGF
jgi:hypothetical protein